MLRSFKTSSSSSSFLKTNKQGGVSRVVRERYLRDDISCGVVDCDKCSPPLCIQGPNILIPDTNIVLHHIDIFDREEFNDVIILQTVLEEVRARSIGLYTKLRNVISSMSKRVYVFSNELCKDTFVDTVSSSDSKTDNDRNDEAIRKAVSWYQDHLRGKNKRIILITNDKENARIAIEQQKIEAIDLVTFCQGNEQLLDIVERSTSIIPGEGVEGEYEEYLEPAQLQEGLDSNVLFKGTLQTSSYNHNEAMISNTLKGTIYISGRSSVNRAIHGDLVVVRLIHSSDHVSEKEILKDREHILVHHQFDSVEMDEESLPSEAVISTGHEREEKVEMTRIKEEGIQKNNPPVTQITLKGKVIGILKKKDRAYCGAIDKRFIQESLKAQNVLFVPMDRRIPRIRIFTRQCDVLIGKRIIVRIDEWDKRSKYPTGHLVKILGQAGDKVTETEAILLEHDVSYQDFTPQVLSCLPRGEDYKPEEWEYANRRDLRDLDICSIDPPGCTDIDDALHARPLDNGNYEIGVHIADVTHFVKATTPLDLEASRRATTIYLVDRRIDMLPPLLGTNLCSIKGNVERFAFSCIWEITQNGKIVSTTFTKSVIMSKASFTYDQAQAILDKPSSHSLGKGLTILNNMAKIFKQKRIDSGALILASPETRFSLDQETQNPVDVELKEMKEANSLVEEFMLLANISVAQQLYKSFPEISILRKHPSPPKENFELLTKALNRRGYEFKTDTSKDLAQSLDNIKDEQDPFFNRLIRMMATRCMYQAVYFASGECSFESFWHYGLACSIYTHFTSPIRRYADVLVHRLLHASIDNTQLGQATCWSMEQLQEICHNINYRHRMAQQAQRSSIELYSHLFFRDRKLFSEQGYIIKVLPESIVFLLSKYGIEGMIKVEGLEFNEKELAFFDPTINSIILQLFQKVKVEMYIEEQESSLRQKMCYKLIEPDISKFVIGEKKKLKS